MREFLTVEREANAIQLKRSSFSGTFLLVEGTSDKKFYGRFMNEETCLVIPLSGKPSSKVRVIQVLEILNKSSFEGVLAIVDADFDNLELSVENNSNLLRTDTHDLETMLLQSPALDKVVREFGSEDKITKFNQDIREVLLEAGILVGYLRWISQTDKLNLTFNSIVFAKFINEKTLQIEKLKLIQEVKNKSQALSLKDKDLQQKLINKKDSNHDPWQVCCGHDLVGILSIGLRKIIGSNKAKEVEADILERNLRLAYEEIYFFDTQLYANIQTWQNNHQPFKILPNNK